MADARDAQSQINQPEVAYDRPTGQGDPTTAERRGTRTATQLAVVLVSILAMVAWTGALVYRDSTTDLQTGSAIVVFLFAVASACIPLQFAYHQEMTFEVTVVILAALLLPLEVAITVCVVGYVFGYALRYRGHFGLDCPYNASIFALSLGMAALTFDVLGWEPMVHETSLARIVVAGLLAAVIWLIITRVLVSLVVALESRQPFRSVLRDSTLGMQSAEQAMLAAMVALGILGAVVAHASPLALLLLLVPAFALWLALRQNVETRHRIEASLATAQLVAGIGSLDWDLKQGDIRWSDILFQILGYAAARGRADGRFLCQAGCIAMTATGSWPHSRPPPRGGRSRSSTGSRSVPARSGPSTSSSTACPAGAASSSAPSAPSTT